MNQPIGIPSGYEALAAAIPWQYIRHWLEPHILITGHFYNGAYRNWRVED